MSLTRFPPTHDCREGWGRGDNDQACASQIQSRNREKRWEKDKDEHPHPFIDFIHQQSLVRTKKKGWEFKDQRCLSTLMTVFLSNVDLAPK